MKTTFDGDGCSVPEGHGDKTGALAHAVDSRPEGHRVCLPVCSGTKVTGGLSEHPHASTEHVITVNLRGRGRFTYDQRTTAKNLSEKHLCLLIHLYILLKNPSEVNKIILIVSKSVLCHEALRYTLYVIVQCSFTAASWVYACWRHSSLNSAAFVIILRFSLKTHVSPSSR